MSLKKSDIAGKIQELNVVLDKEEVPLGQLMVVGPQEPNAVPRTLAELIKASVITQPPPLGEHLPAMSPTLLEIFKVRGVVTGSAAAVGMSQSHSDLDIVIRESLFYRVVSGEPDFCEGELGGSAGSEGIDGFASMKWKVEEGPKVTLLNLLVCRTELAFCQWVSATKLSRVVPSHMVDSRTKRAALYQEVFDMISKRWPVSDEEGAY